LLYKSIYNKKINLLEYGLWIGEQFKEKLENKQITFDVIKQRGEELYSEILKMEVIKTSLEKQKLLRQVV